MIERREYLAVVAVLRALRAQSISDAFGRTRNRPFAGGDADAKRLPRSRKSSRASAQARRQADIAGSEAGSFAVPVDRHRLDYGVTRHEECRAQDKTLSALLPAPNCLFWQLPYSRSCALSGLLHNWLRIAAAFLAAATIRWAAMPSCPPQGQSPHHGNRALARHHRPDAQRGDARPAAVAPRRSAELTGKTATSVES